jgi:predicted flap endonuclease-1-like 5' DNA nuclease/chromosome segregation ATPase
MASRVTGYAHSTWAKQGKNDQMDSTFFGFDMSSAVPWMLMGALIAALLIFLLQALIGTKRRLRAEIAALQASLAGERNNLNDQRGRIHQLEEDSSNYQTALADASKRAAQGAETVKTHEATISSLKRDIDSRYIQIKGFEEELARHTGENNALKRAHAAASDQIARLTAESDQGNQAKAEATKLRSDLSQALANFAALRTEFDQRTQVFTAKSDQQARLQSEYDALSKSAASQADELQRIKAEYARAAADMDSKLKLASSHGDELQRVKSDLARVTAELDATTRLAAEHATAAQKLQGQVAEVSANDGEAAKLRGEIQRLASERDAKAELASHHIEHGQKLQAELAQHAANADVASRLVSAREAELEALRNELANLKSAATRAAAPDTTYAAAGLAAQAEEIQRLRLVITNLQSEIEAKSRHAAAALASAAGATGAAATIAGSSAIAAPAAASGSSAAPAGSNGSTSAASPAPAYATSNGFASSPAAVRPDVNATLPPEGHAPATQAIPTPAASSAPKPLPEPPRPAAPAASRSDLNHLRSVKSEALRTANQDDLKLIQGIGPLIETRLNALGVTSYAQIASWNATDVERFSEAFDIRGRIQREGWIEQAKILASGQHTHFSSQFTVGQS